WPSWIRRWTALRDIAGNRWHKYVSSRCDGSVRSMVKTSVRVDIKRESWTQWLSAARGAAGGAGNAEVHLDTEGSADFGVLSLRHAMKKTSPTPVQMALSEILKAEKLISAPPRRCR